MQDSLSPREIQARIRSGATPEELAEESGMPLKAIERYAGPPLAERSWAVERARSCTVRPGERSLESIMFAEATGQGVDPDTVGWDSWRRYDGRWTIVAEFATGAGSQVATWVYDARSGSIQADDANAQRLAAEDVVVPFTSARRHHTQVIPTRSDDADEAAAEALDDLAPVLDLSAATVTTHEQMEVDVEIDIVEEVEVTAISLSADDAPTTADPEPSKRGKRGRRASVPSWDEILFGSHQSDT